MNNNTVAVTFAAYLAASNASDAAHKAYRAAVAAEAALHAARKAWRTAVMLNA
jgi:hypothetical protein